MLAWLNRYGLTGPLIAVVGGFAALVFLDAGGQSNLVVSQDSLGPTSWPRVMLWGVVASGLLWAALRQRVGHRTAQTPAPLDAVKLAGGILAVVLYGAAMVYVGFAFATFLFLVVWFFVGGLRKPLPVLANGILGTVVLLYLFLKVAYLPLPRGVGYMDTLTVGLYRLLGIF